MSDIRQCFFCNESQGVSEWQHPESGAKYLFCEYCLQSVVGICSECGGILSKFDPIGVNNEGERICYKCSAAHDMAEDDI